MSICEYTFDSVVRIVIVAVVITLLIIGFFISAVWLYLCKRNAHKFDISYDPNATQLSIIKPSQLNKNQSRFAFDNPYFKDDENEFITTNDDKLGFNYNNGTNDATILSNGSALQNDFNRNGQTNPIVNYVLNKNKISSNKQTKAWEDSDVYRKPENISVDLIGHDFTGLGFNIRGNMRDGIFIKDVLSRGPANESKKMKPGDKLSSITISMNNMVYEDALTILSYASPYNVKLNLERENETSLRSRKEIKTNKSNLKTQRTLGNYKATTMLHPLYKTRSVDNLIQIGKYDKLNYGTTQSNFNRKNERAYETDTRNGYGRMINKFKQQIITYLNPTPTTHNGNTSTDSEHTNEIFDKRSNRIQPISSIQNLFKSNKPNWSDEYANEGLNAVVVGNNLAFKDDDEDEDFRRQYQLSQLKYQQRTSQNAFDNQPHSLQNEQTGVRYNRNTAYTQRASNEPTNLIKYHQMNNLSQVDNVQSLSQFVNINLNEFSNQARHDDMDYTCKGNSTRPNDLNDNSLTPSSSQSSTSVPLDDADRQSNDNTTVAEIHTVVDQDDLVNRANVIETIETDDSQMKNVDKPRSSSMNDLQANVSSNQQISTDPAAAINSQSTLERAISLDLSSQAEQNESINSKLSKSAFTKDDQQMAIAKHKRLINSKTRNQPLKQQSLNDLTYDRQNVHMLSNEKLSQQSLTNNIKMNNLQVNSLQTGSLSVSNGKLSNQSKSIRNSLSTNSTCSSQSLLSSETREYDDYSILMLKSSPEENNSILIRNNEKNRDLTPATSGSEKDVFDSRLDDRLDDFPLDDESYARESILFVNDQHKTDSMIDDQTTTVDIQEPNVNLFINKNEKQAKIMNDATSMSSIRFLNSIKSDKQADDLFSVNKTAQYLSDQSSIQSSLDNVNRKFSNHTTIPPTISNFKISSTKKQIPVISMSSDHSSTLFSSNVPAKDNNIITKDISADGERDVSTNKENELKLSINQDQISQQTGIQSNKKLEQMDEIGQLRNRVSKLKKEFSLRQKEIENQNRKSNIKKYRKSSDNQANSVLFANRQIRKPSATSSISKKQEQLINSTSLDFESWTFNSNKDE